MYRIALVLLAVFTDSSFSYRMVLYGGDSYQTSVTASASFVFHVVLSSCLLFSSISHSFFHLSSSSFLNLSAASVDNS